MRVLSVVAATVLLAAHAASAAELVVDIDFNDEVMIRTHAITAAEVEKLVRDLHAHGADTLLVRMGYLGYLPYRTKLSYPVGFDAEHARKHPCRRNMPEEELERFIKGRSADNARYAKVIQEGDVFTGNLIKYDKKNDRVIMKGDIKATDTGPKQKGRVRMTIQPNK